MKKLLNILGIIFLSVYLSGCTGSCKHQLSHTKSNWIGINREIIMYSGGKEIYRSFTEDQVENLSNGIRFFDTNDCVVVLMGDVIIKEIK